MNSSDQSTSQQVISISVRKLRPHPANPNRMKDESFRKLVNHIEQTGQYEPIVVRAHPDKEGLFQILNGHHRLRVLKQLKYTHADCVIFKADDAQAMVYLATLNQLAGKDNVYKKSRLIEQLSKLYSSRQLSKMLPDSKTAIEKLNRLSLDQKLPTPKSPGSFLMPMTFFLTADQHQLICEAFDKAAGENKSGTRTQKRIGALCRLAKHYLGADAT
jgi:ParB/RepB/Spo0J family partition protein